MTRLQRSAKVGYTPQQMFDLVNAVTEYPNFLPWCRSARVQILSIDQVEATLDIAWSGLRKSFTTQNTLYAADRIDIRLVKGPFRRLEGHWIFEMDGERGCQVTLELEFELAGHFLDGLFQPVFYYIANSLVDAFCKRAVDVYGKN